MSAASEREHRPQHQESRRVVALDASDPRWDSFVLAVPGATPFHHSGWLAALERENGQRPLRLACEEPDGTLSGILPLMATSGLPFGIGGPSAGQRLSSLPRTPVAGPLGTDKTVLRALLKAAVARAEEAGLRLQLKQVGSTLDDLVPGLRGQPWRPTYLKALPEDPGQIRFGTPSQHSNNSRAARKARREGLTVRDAANEADLADWYRLYLDANRRLGLPSRPYRLFQAAWAHLRLGGFLRLLLVYHRQSGHDVMLAGSMLLMLGETVFAAFIAGRKDAQRVRPNDLLQWQAMQDAAAAGYRWYDLGEVEPGNDGLARFKAKWGTEMRTLTRYHAPPIASCDAEYRKPGRTWQRRVAVGAWRRVPLPVTAFAGDRLYQFL
ncbi:MAG: GNAT family N-acetyltransferase [Actinobacteria bacterium]|nr:GNAT family N-acetyltransferase [Actinomycetota bacterium]